VSIVLLSGKYSYLGLGLTQCQQIGFKMNGCYSLPKKRHLLKNKDW